MTNMRTTNRLPEGTTIGVSQLATYRSTDNFTDPYSFIPERWLSNKEDSRFMNDDQSAFQPFSIGPRNCIGQSIAYFEARLLLASVLRQFDCELDSSCDDWVARLKIFLLWEKKPLFVRLRESDAGHEK